MDRDNGEGRRIRPIPGLSVDVLGAGFTIVPPSYGPDLGTGGRHYAFALCGAGQ